MPDEKILLVIPSVSELPPLSVGDWTVDHTVSALIQPRDHLLFR